ncbi:MAG TPA: methylated-DNA--[protein]-cysteine S-methyltransferase [Microbacterium sp.]|nr:methylated-DNA--[protein]-cysteine S-methyltransferase [Microbacterium sp.]
MTRAAFAVHPTPVGDALLIFTTQGLAGLDVIDDGDDVTALLVGAQARLGMTVEHDEAAAERAGAQLDEYFAAQRRAFDLKLDLRGLTPFGLRVLSAIGDIPYGQTASYGEIAARAGNPGAHRAAGSVCASTPVSIVIPAHRVVRSDGSLGQYGRHPEIKRYLLDLEQAAGE